jgi:hypothetical protein
MSKERKGDLKRNGEERYIVRHQTNFFPRSDNRLEDIINILT